MCLMVCNKFVAYFKQSLLQILIKFVTNYWYQFGSNYLYQTLKNLYQI
jgi:hypothetical protein